MAVPFVRKKRRRATTSDLETDILQILLFHGVIKGDQIELVNRAMQLRSLSAPDAVVHLGISDEVQIARALALYAGLPFTRIDPLALDLTFVTEALSAPFARKHGLVPIAKHNGRITIAVHNPLWPFPEHDIRHVTGLIPERVVAPRSDIELVSKGFYELKTTLKSAEQAAASRANGEGAGNGIYDLKANLKTAEEQLQGRWIDLGNQEFLSTDAKELDPADTPVVRALDQILNYAFDQHASDVHFEPKRNMTLVRLRIDGILHDVHVVPRIVYQALVSRLKLLSGCNLAEKRRPQDGRIKREQGGREVEVRVSTMPTAFGEKTVLRIFDPDVLVKHVNQLGFDPDDLERFTSMLKCTTGIVLVTGPTGSGKTTTLYSALRQISRPEVNIVTIEEPIEMVMEEFNQVAVRPKIDITFANALRTVLRQDPDVIMVGEIRDRETAENAVQAALTGHLVLSTLHTNDAPSAVTRLMDLGVPHFLITSTLMGVIAQRLVRVNCPNCVEEYTATPEEALLLQIPHEELVRTPLKRGRGCMSCRQTGFYGREGVFQVLPISERIRHIVAPECDSSAIFKAAREEGMYTLREAGVQKALRGITTVREILRVTGDL